MKNLIIFSIISVLLINIESPAAPSTKTLQSKRKSESQKSSLSQSFDTGLLIWGEYIQLLTFDGRKEEIDIKYSGLSASYSLGFKYDSWIFGASAEAWFMQGRAIAEGKNITYEDKVSSTFPILILTYADYFPKNNVSVGIELGAMYHQLTLSAPTSIITSYEFQYSAPVKALTSIKLNWFIKPNLALSERVIFFPQSTYLMPAWNVSASYTF